MDQAQEKPISNFKELIAWQRAIDLAPELYAVVATFPDIEQFGLSDQIRRAVISVSTNIAEGQGRRNTGEFVHFLGIARGSLTELESLLIVAKKLNYISDAKLNDLTERIIATRKPLHGLIERFRK